MTAILAYRSLIKPKNPNALTVKREAEEDWGNKELETQIT
jgi:hypothetical protein